uniref:Diphthine--ammonia ligase n=1 Tax=Rhizophora mucronata TaxID=61149 RepID=A0A2P2KEG4_RHIMU
MKVVALVSGGKDSCYAMMKCVRYGHEIVALANLMPADDLVDELDSYMYQTVGHQIIVGYAECMGLPLFRRRIQGSARHQNFSYRTTVGDEVEDMFVLLSEVKRQMPDVSAVSSGAIASDYQRLRVESVCSRLGLVSLAYLWKQDQSLLLQEMITNGIVAITVKVAALGLDPAKHLGKEIAFLKSHLHKLKELYGVNVCGEGGEYETLTLDCPLFVNARIVLDEFQIVLHSSNSIAPVGIIHPSAFHLEKKEEFITNDKSNDVRGEIMGSVFEVQGECPQSETSTAEITDLDGVMQNSICISKSYINTFSICCWLQNTCKTAGGLDEDLNIVLRQIESQLAGYGLSWKHVLYIHLYIADMNDFTRANEIYVKYITQEKCPSGVPSRSTVELPLLQAGLGKAYVEVLVANEQSKNVLHVQSISSWAPSCIGPYSQATLHKGILHMAGQLGLDPPTMTLCKGGSTAEMEQALENCEAVATCFDCSISTSAILFAVYCSSSIPLSERQEIQDKHNSVVNRMRLLQPEKPNKCGDPIFLYVLVPALPKSAFVEVKPLLFVPKDVELANGTVQNPSPSVAASCWGFQQESWHDSCLQKCVVSGTLCAVLLSITNENLATICSESVSADKNDEGHQNSIQKGHVEKVSKFCIYLLDRVITDNGFSWEDTVVSSLDPMLSQQLIIIGF